MPVDLLAHVPMCKVSNLAEARRHIAELHQALGLSLGRCPYKGTRESDWCASCGAELPDRRQELCAICHNELDHASPGVS